MPELRAPIADVVARVLQQSEDSREVTLDEIGDALGVLAVSADEIDAIMTALESAGRRIVGPEEAQGESRLMTVVATARALRDELGRTPRTDEIAARASMPLEAVRHALSLARIMQR